MTLSLLFIPRSRKVNFDIEIIIEELLHVPLISGLYYVKWKLKNGLKSSGMTNRTYIKDHSVRWHYKLRNAVQLIVGKDGFLLPCELHLSIKQVLNGVKEVNNIGRLKINLSEYVGSAEIIRQYLLQDSKINSTLKLSINMKKTSGDVFYKVPPLKKTQIFSGITGIVSDRSERQDDERSIVGLNVNFGAHYISKSKSTTSLRSAYYAHANHITPVTSSLVTNNFLLNVGGKSPTDVIEEIFMGNEENNNNGDNDQRSISGCSANF